MLEQARDAVSHEETDIWLQGVEVRERLLVMAEVGSVIPDVEFGRHRLPGDDIVAKPAVFGGSTGSQRVREAAFNRTEANDDVATRAECLRRFTRILIGEGINPEVGVIVPDVFSDRVDKSEQGCRRAAFPVVQGFADLALAPVAGIILRDADDGSLGMFNDPFAYRCDGQLEHFGIRKTPLNLSLIHI